MMSAAWSVRGNEISPFGLKRAFTGEAMRYKRPRLCFFPSPTRPRPRRRRRRGWRKRKMSNKIVVS